MSSRSARYGDDYGGERWDRQRFERVRARSRGPIVEERIRVEEYDDGPRRRDVRVEVDEGRSGPHGRWNEDEVEVVMDPEYSPPSRRRRPQVEEERVQISQRELMPYRPREKWGRDNEVPNRRPTRPMYSRRQSSLDTYDRRPLPKYHDEERDINVKINVVPPPEPRYRDRRYPREPQAYKAEESSDSLEEIEVPEQPRKPKRGKTRMPKRLVHRAALIQLGYSFDEEVDFYIVRQALEKPRIDEVIKISETYFSDNKVVYKFQDTKLIEAPAPPPPRYAASEIAPDEVPVEIYETVTTKIIENPTPEDFAAIRQGSRSVHKSVASGSSSRSSSTAATARPTGAAERTVVAELRASGDNPIVVPHRRKSVKASKGRHGAKSAAGSSGSESESETAMAIVHSRRKSTAGRDIQAEIRHLEQEQRRMEREDKKESRRESESFETTENRDRATVVRVEKDKRGRLSLVRPTR